MADKLDETMVRLFKCTKVNLLSTLFLVSNQI